MKLGGEKKGEKMNNEVKSISDVLDLFLKHVGNEERLAHIKALRGLNDTLSALKANYEFMGASWAGRYGYECTPKNIKIHYGNKQQTYTWEVIAKMVDKRIYGADTEVFEQLALFRI